MRSPSSIILCAVLVAAGCHRASARVDDNPAPRPGPPVVVRGVVMDMTSNSPLSDVGIELMLAGQSAQSAIVTATDVRGEFVLDPVPPGTYRLRVVRTGYNEVRMRVDVVSPDQRPLTIHLRSLGIRCPPSRYHTPECP
jgi:hypothetical protein